MQFNQVNRNAGDVNNAVPPGQAGGTHWQELLAAAEAVVEFIRHGTAIYPGSLAACDLEDAVCRVKGLPTPYRTGQDGPIPF